MPRVAELAELVPMSLPWTSVFVVPAADERDAEDPALAAIVLAEAASVPPIVLPGERGRARIPIRPVGEEPPCRVASVPMMFTWISVPFEPEAKMPEVEFPEIVFPSPAFEPPITTPDEAVT